MSGGWSILLKTTGVKPQTSEMGNFHGLLAHTNFKQMTVSTAGGRNSFGSADGFYEGFFTTKNITKLALVDGTSTSLTDLTSNTNYIIYNLVESSGTETMFQILDRLDTYAINNNMANTDASGGFTSPSVINFTAGTNGYSGLYSARSSETAFGVTSKTFPDKICVWGINIDSDDDVQVFAAYWGDLKSGKGDGWRFLTPNETLWSLWGNDWHNETKNRTISALSNPPNHHTSIQTSPGINAAVSTYTGAVYLLGYSAPTSIAPTLGDFNDSKTFGTGSFNVIQPSSPSTGAFTYSITSGTDVISVSGTTITILQAGSATIQASQAASGSYLAATKTATINITPATPTLGDFNDSRTFGTGSFNVIQPSSPSTGAFTYSITSGTDVISISGTTITILKAGSATIQAFQTASTNYVAVTKNATININRAAGTLSVTKSIFYQKFVSGASVPFDVISSNAGTVSRTHESNNTSIVSIPSSSSPAATIVGPGKTTIKVTQPQQTSYEQIIEYSLVTIVIIGSGLTYSSENMTSLDLTGTNLSGSVFSSCILTSANLFGATVNASTNLSSATLTNVRSGRIIGTTSLLPSDFKMI